MHNIIYIKDACGRPQPTIEYSFLPLLRRFNPAEPVVEKICNPLED
jgi:hypothetical protein